MKMFLALPLLTVALPAAAQPGDRYRATGTEPFWSLTIERGTMRLEQPGQRRLTVAAPVPRPSFNGRRYITQAITVDITRAACSDGMSDRRYPETVTVQLGGRTLRGCGLADGPAQSARNRLAGTRWNVVAVDGRMLPLGRRPTVNFTAERVEGRACNSYGGGYRFFAGRLTTSGITSTRMACQASVQRVENKLFAVLKAPATVRFIGGNRIELRGRGSITLTAAY